MIPDPEIPVVSVARPRHRPRRSTNDGCASPRPIPAARRPKSSNAPSARRSMPPDTAMSPSKPCSPRRGPPTGSASQGKAALHGLRHRTARTGEGRDLPAMRLDRHRRSQPLRLNPVQGAMALQGLPGALRPLQVPLIIRTALYEAAYGPQAPARPLLRPPAPRGGRRRDRGGPRRRDPAC